MLFMQVCFAHLHVCHVKCHFTCVPCKMPKIRSTAMEERTREPFHREHLLQWLLISLGKSSSSRSWISITAHSSNTSAVSWQFQLYSTMLHKVISISGLPSQQQTGHMHKVKSAHLKKKPGEASIEICCVDWQWWEPHSNFAQILFLSSADGFYLSNQQEIYLE